MIAQRKQLVALGAMVVMATASSALALANYPHQANSYGTWMVRAMDECAPSGMSVVGQPACPQANVITDDEPGAGATMRVARLTVRKLRTTGKVTLYGAGFKPGQRVAVSLMLRTSKAGQTTKHPPQTGQRITFADVAISCGNGFGGCFVAGNGGAIAASQNLSDCLTQNGLPASLASTNVEILDAALVNCDTGKIFARPGILE